MSFRKIHTHSTLLTWCFSADVQKSRSAKTSVLIKCQEECFEKNDTPNVVHSQWLYQSASDPHRHIHIQKITFFCLSVTHSLSPSWCVCVYILTETKTNRKGETNNVTTTLISKNTYAGKTLHFNYFSHINISQILSDDNCLPQFGFCFFNSLFAALILIMI